MFEIDISQALVNASEAFDALRSLVFAVAVLVGVVLFIKGVKYCIILGNTNGPSLATPSKAIWHLIFGAFFAAFAFTVSAPWSTITGSEGNISIVAYDMPGTDAVPEIYAKVITAALEFIQLVGYCFCFYGLLILLKAAYGEANSSGESPVMGGTWRFLGGLACINIGPFLLGLSNLLTGAG